MKKCITFDNEDSLRTFLLGMKLGQTHEVEGEGQADGWDALVVKERANTEDIEFYHVDVNGNLDNNRQVEKEFDWVPREGTHDTKLDKFLP